MITLVYRDGVFTLVYKGQPMVVSLSQDSSNVALDALAAKMDGGRIELLSSDDSLLAVLKLSSPSAPAADGGTIELNPITPGTAAKPGQVETARILAADGSEIFTCDVGTMDSDAVIRLDATSLHRGDEVRISSFTLSMP